jgi:hypothetical protein
LIIHGIYAWAVRRVAFRHDFCRGCAQPTLAVRMRAFRVLHLYWVPVLPLGFWRTWHCSRCGRSPDANLRTRRGFKVAGAVTLALLAAAVWWDAPDDARGGELVFVWSLLIGLPLAATLAVRSVLRHRPGDRQRGSGLAVLGTTASAAAASACRSPPRLRVAHEPLASGRPV